MKYLTLVSNFDQVLKLKSPSKKIWPSIYSRVWQKGPHLLGLIGSKVLSNFDSKINVNALITGLSNEILCIPVAQKN